MSFGNLLNAKEMSALEIMYGIIIMECLQMVMCLIPGL